MNFWQVRCALYKLRSLHALILFVGVTTLVSAILLSNGIAFISSANAQEQEVEYAVKAAYLYKLMPFVDWPPQRFSAPDSPFHLCIAGHDPFGNVIDDIVANVRIGQRRVEVSRLSTSPDRIDCHLLYINGNLLTVKRWLNQVEGQATLTVTELEPGESPIGMINFIVVNSRVRFAVDNIAAQNAGLKLSAKLLALATTVTGSSP